MNLLANRFFRLFNNVLITILTLAVLGSLFLVAVGSHNTSKISEGFQEGIITDFQLQQINGKIGHYDEILTMSARMTAATGNLSWKERYDAYEPLLIDAIDSAIELSPEAFMPFATQINTANTKLINLESRAFGLVEQNQAQAALEILFGDAYIMQKEAYGNGLQQWSAALNEEVSTNLTNYGKSLSLSSTFSVVSFWVLVVAWIALLRLANQYVQRRAIAENRLIQAKRQLEASHQESQASKAALQKKAVALEAALLELQQTQVQIVQSEKMSSLGQLVAGIAHEINNPVNFIHANLEPIGDYTSDLRSLLSCYQTTYSNPTPNIKQRSEEIDIEFIKKDMPAIIRSMQVGTHRIREIVLSLRNFSRSDEQGLKTVDIHQGLESTLLILQHKLKESAKHLPIPVHREYGNLPLVKCYPGQLNQVFMNLLSNAIDAIEEGTEARQDESPRDIMLTTSTLKIEGKDWVQISIADTGLGMSEAVQSRMFDAFYTTKSIGKGTGMGLSISHTIITQKHGGSLSCRSFVGKGTEFIVQIPVVVSLPTEESLENTEPGGVLVSTVV